MLSLSTSIIKLNQFTIREMVGVTINDMFVHVTKKSLRDVFTLTEIALCSAFIPFLFLWWMIPSKKATEDFQKN